MPFSLGHFAFAYLIHKSKKTLSLPGLIIGSIISDIDILFNYLTRGYVGRESLHSFIGAKALRTLSMLSIVLFYPLAVSAFLGIGKEEVRQMCKLSKTVLVSSLIGGFSHVLLDSKCHKSMIEAFAGGSVEAWVSGVEGSNRYWGMKSRTMYAEAFKEVNVPFAGRKAVAYLPI